MSSTIQTNIRKLRVYTRRSLKFDVVAAIVVFLVAIPLCLGIALASGAPLFSGIVSGIIGGIVVGTLSGSHTSVSGPAAGMAAVVLAALSQLGDFPTFLLALTFAGFLQVVIGYLRAGVVADFISSHVIQGLLCAIGILLIVKQLPLAFSLSADINEFKIHLLETTEGFTLTPLFNLYHHIDGGALFISSVSFAILVYFEKTKNALLKNIPAPIVVVIAGIFLNTCFILWDSSLAQDSPQLVNIPEITGIKDFISQLQFPNWESATNPKVYLYGCVIAIVASLETLLNLKGVEKLDKKHRSCSSDRELMAQGAGNIISGLLGGIPITSVIVRTSVNIEAGSKTKVSTILHGIFILFAVMLLPDALNKIPLSSLASLLIYTGYKLSKPAVFIEIYKQGLDRFIPFIVTVISIVAFNVLAGILIGLATSLFFILKSNSEARFDIIKEIYPNGVTHRLLLPQQVTFLNKAAFVAELNAIPKRSQLIIDARYATYIDREIVEYIHEFKEEQAPTKNIALNLVGFAEQYRVHNHINFITVTTYDVQSVLTAKSVLKILHEGNQRFINDTRIHRMPKMDMQHTAKTQHPIAVVLSCVDSRVPVETIFDMTFGDLLIVRVAGNVVNTDVLASIEYACSVAKAKLIVVLGHSRCGAIQAACDGIKKGHITQLLEKIQPAIAAEVTTVTNRTSTNIDFVNKVTHLNVANTLQGLYHKSPILSDLIQQEEIGLVGAVYDVESGVVRFNDYSKDYPFILPIPQDLMNTNQKANWGSHKAKKAKTNTNTKE